MIVTSSSVTLCVVVVLLYFWMNHWFYNSPTPHDKDLIEVHTTNSAKIVPLHSYVKWSVRGLYWRSPPTRPSEDVCLLEMLAAVFSRRLLGTEFSAVHYSQSHSVQSRAVFPDVFLQFSLSKLLCCILMRTVTVATPLIFSEIPCGILSRTVLLATYVLYVESFSIYIGSWEIFWEQTWKITILLIFSRHLYITFTNCHAVFPV